MSSRRPIPVIGRNYQAPEINQENNQDDDTQSDGTTDTGSVTR